MILRILAAIGEHSRHLFRLFGFGLIRVRELDRLRVESEFAERYFRTTLVSSGALTKSHSQLGQELMVLGFLENVESGYFVEFGATDGVTLSNTYLLEKEFGWKGILAEPASVWHKKLSRNRNCHIDRRAVWVRSGEKLAFNEVDVAELSTLNAFSHIDSHSDARLSGKVYEVETISLRDLLLHYSAPKVIDYLSIDTEGSELSILSSFDFQEYSFKIITVEHNGTSARKEIFEVLSSHGYVRILRRSSRWDDWYVLPEVLGGQRSSS